MSSMDENRTLYRIRPLNNRKKKLFEHYKESLSEKRLLVPQREQVLSFDIFRQVIKKTAQIAPFLKTKPENSEGFFVEQVNKILLPQAFIFQL